MKPKYQSLENFLKEELRKELQDQQFALAIEKIEALHERRRQHTSEWPHLFNANPDSCNHLKGGRFRALHSYRDYAIRLHTFPDGHANVKCTICGKEWDPASQEALEMLDRTSNTRTSSEVLMTYDPFKAKETKAVFVEPLEKEKKWTLSSTITTARTALQRRTSRRKSTRKRS